MKSQKSSKLFDRSYSQRLAKRLHLKDSYLPLLEQLITAASKREKVRLHYGDTKTGEFWGDTLMGEPVICTWDKKREDPQQIVLEVQEFGNEKKVEHATIFFGLVLKIEVVGKSQHSKTVYEHKSVRRSDKEAKKVLARNSKRRHHSKIGLKSKADSFSD